MLLAVVHTWPLATAPGRLSRNDNADTVLNEWIVAWVQHQGVRHPLNLFDANIFYPDRHTLAYSEPLIVPAVMGAPVRAAGGSPVLVYNLLLLAGLALSGVSMSALIGRWTGDQWAGLVAGTIVAFNAHTLTRLPQLQALHMEFLPLTLLAFDRLLDATARPVRAAMALSALMVLQGLTSYYTLVLAGTALAAGWIVRVEEWRDGRASRRLLLVAVAAAATLAALAPVLWPYVQTGQTRSLDEVALYSAEARNYLATPSRLHFGAWSHRFFGGTTALFPGVTALALTVIAVASGVAIRDRRARMALAFGVFGVALSFGPAMPLYGLLYRLVIPLQGIRNAARFGYLATVAAAVLSGFAVALIRSRMRHTTASTAVAVLLLAAANADALSSPIDYVDAQTPSPIHDRLRGVGAVVAEFPLYPPDRIFRNAPYLIDSTRHWRPMVNGYSGITPESYVSHARELQTFPAPAAIDALRTLGVTHVFVHDRALRDWTDNETADAVTQAAGLQLMARDEEVALYAVR